MTTRRWTVLEALQWTVQAFRRAGIEPARLDAELLLAEATGLDRVGLYVAHDRPLSASERARFRALVKARSRGEPVAYLLGRKEFWSLTFEVTRAVLVPRPDTECLVEAVLRWARPRADRPLRIVDVGTGCGAIAVALAHELPRAWVVAIDVSAEAVVVARRNVVRHGVAERVAVVAGDTLQPIASRRSIDVVVSNPPYVPTGRLAALPRDVRDHEPRLALDGGADGMRVLAPIVRCAAARLRAGGLLALEIGDPAQADRVAACIVATRAFEPPAVGRDVAGRARFVTARALASPAA